MIYYCRDFRKELWPRVRAIVVEIAFLVNEPTFTGNAKAMPCIHNHALEADHEFIRRTSS